MLYEKNVVGSFVAIFLSMVPVLYRNAIQKDGNLLNDMSSAGQKWNASTCIVSCDLYD